jgi:hypothetical protein
MNERKLEKKNVFFAFKFNYFAVAVLNIELSFDF